MTDSAKAPESTAVKPPVRPIVWKLGLATFLFAAATGTILAYREGLPPIFGEIHGLDKVAHFGIFGSIAFFLDAVLKQRNIASRVPLAALLILIPAGIEEFLQRYSPNRSSDFGDFAADLAGVTIGVLLSRRIAKRRQSSS